MRKSRTEVSDMNKKILTLVPLFLVGGTVMALWVAGIQIDAYLTATSGTAILQETIYFSVDSDNNPDNDSIDYVNSDGEVDLRFTLVETYTSSDGLCTISYKDECPDCDYLWSISDQSNGTWFEFGGLPIIFTAPEMVTTTFDLSVLGHDQRCPVDNGSATILGNLVAWYNCTEATTITCGASVGGTTSGGTDDMDFYYGVPGDHSSEEVIYKFTGTGQNTNVSLGNGGRLDVIVLNPCNQKQVIASGDHFAYFMATAATDYWLVVDGYGATQGYTIDVTCT